jgi:hypothetical protein
LGQAASEKFGKTEIFLQKGLDRPVTNPPSDLPVPGKPVGLGSNSRRALQTLHRTHHGKGAADLQYRWDNAVGNVLNVILSVIGHPQG